MASRYNRRNPLTCVEHMLHFRTTLLMVLWLLCPFSAVLAADSDVDKQGPVTPEVVEPASPEPAVGDKGADKGAETWEATKQISREAWEATQQTSREVWDETKETSQELWEATKSGARKTGEYAGKAWHKTKEVSKDAWDATTEAAEAAGRAGKKAYEDAVGNTDEPKSK